jgi:hypothetical protein
MIIDRARSFFHKSAAEYLPEDLGTPRPISLASLCPSTRPSAARGLLCPLHSTAAVARPAAHLALSLKRSRSRQTMLHLNASRGIPFFLLPAQLGLALRFNQLAVIFTFDLSG